MRIRWYGFDFGETIMNPFTLHQSALIRRVYSDLGKAEEAEVHVQKWYRLRDSFGSAGEASELRVRLVKQYAKGRIYSEVLDNNKEAIRLFEKGEAEGFTPAEGIKPALARLGKNGTIPAIVSESSEIAATQGITRFLDVHGLSALISEIITPAGRFSVNGTLLGSGFVGKTKKAGTIYDELRAYLRRLGTRTEEAAIVGDDPVLDIASAKERGFVTVQYTGIIKRPKRDGRFHHRRLVEASYHDMIFVSLLRSLHPYPVPEDTNLLHFCFDLVSVLQVLPCI